MTTEPDDDDVPTPLRASGMLILRFDLGDYYVPGELSAMTDDEIIHEMTHSGSTALFRHATFEVTR